MKSLPPPEVPSFSSPFFYTVGVATLAAPGSPSFTMVLYYRPPTKLLESNVFGHLCLSFCSRRGGGMWPSMMLVNYGLHRDTAVSHFPSPYRDPPPRASSPYRTPHPALPTYSTWTSRCRDSPPPTSCIDIFKLIHYVVWTVGKRADSIRLKCLFVTICNVFTRVCNSVHREGGVSVPVCTTGHMTRGSPGVSVQGGGFSVREKPLGQRPPYGNERAVRILLECILVHHFFSVLGFFFFVFLIKYFTIVGWPELDTFGVR